MGAVHAIFYTASGEETCATLGNPLAATVAAAYDRTASAFNCFGLLSSSRESVYAIGANRGQHAMAGESKHEKTDRGRRSRPAYERLHPDEVGRSPGSESHECLPQHYPSHDEQRLLECLLRASHDGIVLCEGPSLVQNGRLTDVNDGLCRMLGYTREEILELTPLRLVSKEARKAIPRITQRIERSGWLLFETTLTAKDRRQIPVEINADILVFHGRRMVLAIIRDITERQKEIRELKHRAGRLQKLTFELLQAADRERKRLAEVLHDDLQQTLAAATFQLGRLTSRVRSEAQLQEIVAQVQQMLKDAIEKARSLSHELGPVLLARGGLDETFEWLARQMEQRHGLAVHVETRGRVDSSSEPVRTFLYRAAQEILFNVVKHAQVSEARLRLQRVRNQIWLTISDKGQGFDPRSLARTAGFGLLSVRERAELLGGRMRIRSTMGRGSTFLITIPDTGRSPADDSTTGSPPPGTD